MDDDGVGSGFRLISAASNRPDCTRSLKTLNSTSSSCTSAPTSRNCSCSSRAYRGRSALDVGTRIRKASGWPPVARMPSPLEPRQPAHVSIRPAWAASYGSPRVSGSQIHHRRASGPGGTCARSSHTLLRSPSRSTAIVSARRSRRSPNSACGFVVSPPVDRLDPRSEEHTSELQSLAYLVCRLLLEKKKQEQVDRLRDLLAHRGDRLQEA